MKRKNVIIVIVLSIITFLVILRFMNPPNSNQNSIDSWVGEYSFEEYTPPNIGRMYYVTIYEDDGLYARIKVDGFQTLLRLKTRVVNNGDEILFEFIDYYEDEDRNSITLNEGDILLRFQSQNDGLITLWEKLQPVVTKNQEPGVYFKRIIN